MEASSRCEAGQGEVRQAEGSGCVEYLGKMWDVTRGISQGMRRVFG